MKLWFARVARSGVTGWACTIEDSNKAVQEKDGRVTTMKVGAGLRTAINTAKDAGQIGEDGTLIIKTSHEIIIDLLDDERDRSPELTFCLDRLSNWSVDRVPQNRVHNELIRAENIVSQYEYTVRVKRANEENMEISHIDASRYLVKGQYTVDLLKHTCSCPDHIIRDLTCKHLISVYQHVKNKRNKAANNQDRHPELPNPYRDPANLINSITAQDTETVTKKD